MTIQKGHVFGEMEVLDMNNRITHCTSTQNSQILILPSSIFSKYLDDYKDMLYEIQIDELHKRRKQFFSYQHQQIKCNNPLRKQIHPQSFKKLLSKGNDCELKNSKDYLQRFLQHQFERSDSQIQNKPKLIPLKVDLKVKAEYLKQMKNSQNKVHPSEQNISSQHYFDEIQTNQVPVQIIKIQTIASQESVSYDKSSEMNNRKQNSNKNVSEHSISPFMKSLKKIEKEKIKPEMILKIKSIASRLIDKKEEQIDFYIKQEKIRKRMKKEQTIIIKKSKINQRNQFQLKNQKISLIDTLQKPQSVQSILGNFSSVQQNDFNDLSFQQKTLIKFNEARTVSKKMTVKSPLTRHREQKRMFNMFSANSRNKQKQVDMNKLKENLEIIYFANHHWYYYQRQCLSMLEELENESDQISEKLTNLYF